MLRNEKDVRWGSKFDETVRQVWAMMEEYVKVRYGKDCTNLRSASYCGFLSLILRVVLFRQPKIPHSYLNRSFWITFFCFPDQICAFSIYIVVQVCVHRAVFDFCCSSDE